MCGIFWYRWSNGGAEKILIHGLERLEYRGYDSAGLWVCDDSWNSELLKAVGKVSNLASKVFQSISKDSLYNMWIAHTRWATHGGISEENTHPHQDMNENFTIVHNGIIENYHKLKKELESEWYKFYWQTDTEVVANLLDKNWDGNFLSTVEKVLTQIRWAYALLITSKYSPGEIIWVKRWSPFVFGKNDNGDIYFSSDKQALAGCVSKVMYLEDGELVHVVGNDYSIRTGSMKIAKKWELMDMESVASSKWDFKHFMLKEIYEQPAIIRRICKWRVNFETKQLMAESFHGMHDEDFDKVVFVGCGTSYNAGSLWAYWMQNLAGMDARAEIASEYEYKNMNIDSKTLYVFVSQSWETADSIWILQDLKEKWASTFGIVNVVGSTISRLTDHGLFTRCGAEIWVASTKAFTGQLVCILLLALFLGHKRGLPRAKYERILNELHNLPDYIQSIFDGNLENIREVSEDLMKYKNFFFLWRHYQLPIASEISLKFKEITYLHSESYPAGELKHGPLALIEPNTPSIMCIPHDKMYEKNLSSLQEVKARDGKIVVISDRDVVGADSLLKIVETEDEIYPFLCNVVGQLLSYFTADMMGRDIDKPRNLAKSVTVK